MSFEGFLYWHHWLRTAFGCLPLAVCMCVWKSPQTISWLMNIECWHFFESECQFSQRSKKTQKWVSVCGHVPGCFAPSEMCVLGRSGLCLASAKLQTQGANKSISAIIVNRYLCDASSSFWCFFFPVFPPAERHVVAVCCALCPCSSGEMGVHWC